MKTLKSAFGSGQRDPNPLARNVRTGTNKNLTAKQRQSVSTKSFNKGITYEGLLKEYKGTGKLWEDPHFPATGKSIFVTKSCNLQWKRAKEICPDAKLFEDGASRFDVKQGELGDCWLLAVISSLSMYKDLFYNVVPKNQTFDGPNYIGAFYFRFWRFGEWQEVIVDDRLPVRGNRLVFMHSADSNEFWSALLEKAYAKLCSSYEALSGGSQSEAMEDFTGGLCESVKLDIKSRPKDLFSQMVKFVKRSTLMGCAIESQEIEGKKDNGLITGHAYSVTGATSIKVDGNVIELVRVRNPWGNQYEWKGAWGDKSPEWRKVSDREKRELGIDFDDDGEFWMSYDDFVSNFTKLEVCHLGPESLDGDNMNGKKRWEMCLESGGWQKTTNAGGCRNFIQSFHLNPQYRVEVVDPDEDDDEDNGTMILGLMQKDQRARNLDFLVIGYVIYKLRDPNCGPLDQKFFKYQSMVAKSPGFTNAREVCGRHKLKPGHYVIIPSTFKPKEEANYILRIFTQKPAKSVELDEPLGISASVSCQMHSAPPQSNNEVNIDHNNPEVQKRTQELHRAFKAYCGPSQLINGTQLRDILNFHLKAELKKFSGFATEVCRSIIALYDNNQSGRMEFDEFKKLVEDLRIWKTAYKNHDADFDGVFDSMELRQALSSIGYKVSNKLFSAIANRYSDGDTGHITFEDYILCVVRLKNSFESFRIQDKDSSGRAVFKEEEFLCNWVYC